jgi:hypothetical protein
MSFDAALARLRVLFEDCDLDDDTLSMTLEAVREENGNQGGDDEVQGAIKLLRRAGFRPAKVASRAGDQGAAHGELRGAEGEKETETKTVEKGAALLMAVGDSAATLALQRQFPTVDIDVIHATLDAHDGEPEAAAAFLRKRGYVARGKSRTEETSSSSGGGEGAARRKKKERRRAAAGEGASAGGGSSARSASRPKNAPKATAKGTAKARKKEKSSSGAKLPDEDDEEALDAMRNELFRR